MKKNYVLNISIMGLMTALICVVAPFAIPLPGGVPVSLTHMMIYLIVYLIGGKKGTVCYCLYLLIGLAGLPVFANFTGGFAKLSGPTGGYLIGFIFTAALCGLFLYIGKGNIFIYIIGMVTGLAAAYLFGSVWFLYSMNVSLSYTLKVCVIPFLPADAVKIALIAVVAPLIKKAIKNAPGMENVLA